MENGKIYEAISNVMAEIGAIGKEKKNLQQGFMYRGVDDVMNALQPALIKYKVFITPTVGIKTQEERTTAKGGVIFYVTMDVTYKFYTTDGSFIECAVFGEAMDSGDKAVNKAMSIAFKYACFQVFCIPTEEMIDPDADVYDPASKGAKQAKIDKPKTITPPAAQTAQTTKAAPPPVPTPEQMAEIAKQVINDVKIKTIRGELERTGVQETAICKRYGFAKIDECTEELFVKVMSALNKKKTKEVATNE